MVNDPIHTEIPALLTGWPCNAVNCRMAIENRPIAKPNTTIAAPVRTHARKVLSFAKWSRARLEFSTTYPLMPPALFHSLQDQRCSTREIFHQLLRHTVTLLQIPRIVIGHRDFSLGVLGDQGLERQINRETWSRHHQRSSSLRAAKYQQLRWPHLQANFLR